MKSCYRDRGISSRSRKAVHWLKTILLAPSLPDWNLESRSSSSSLKRKETLDDSTQLLSTSILKRLLVGAVIRSCLLMLFRQMGQRPEEAEEEPERQLEKRHSRHMRCAHGVSTASSRASRQMGHSPPSPFSNSSTTSFMYAFDAPSSPLSNLFVSLLKSEYSCVSPRLHNNNITYQCVICVKV